MKLKKLLLLIIVAFTCFLTSCNFDFVDYEALTNKITTETMKCNVTVTAQCYNTVFNLKTDGIEKTGSGIIVQETEGYYIIVTNNHVVYDEKYSHVTYSVTDYLGNNYGSVKIHNASADYDLAILSIKKTDSKLGVIDIAGSNPSKLTKIVSLGQPKGQSNAITYGKILKYESVTLQDNDSNSSNVNFKVIVHDASISNGSSGGALLDTKLRLVGINYAGCTDDDGDFKFGLAIPIEKVIEFYENSFE